MGIASFPGFYWVGKAGYEAMWRDTYVYIMLYNFFLTIINL